MSSTKGKDMNERYPELDYYMNEEFCDSVFIIDGIRVPVVSQYLAIKSPVFEELFKESKNEITLIETDCEGFKAVIRHLYTDEVIVTNNSEVNWICEVMRIAIKYQILQLITQINEVIKNVMKDDNFDRFCETAHECNNKSLLPIIKDYMRDNCDSFVKKDIDYLKRIDNLTDQSWMEVCTSYSRTEIWGYSYGYEGNRSAKRKRIEESFPESDHLFNESKSDVVFIVEGQRVPALRQVLSLKSPVLKAKFSGKWPKDSKETEIHMEGMNYEAFKVVIRFMYSERMALPNDQIDLINMSQDILKIAHYYRLLRLMDKIGAIMIEKLDLTNFHKLAKIVYFYDVKGVIPTLQQFVTQNIKQFCRKDFNELKQINDLMDNSLLEIMAKRIAQIY